MGSWQPAVWEIRVHTIPRKIVAIVVILATCGFMLLHIWSLFLAAWITRSGTPDAAIYERAIQYDPWNADYHFALAGIYNSSTPYLSPVRAGEEFELAVQLNPNRAAQWLELSKFCEEQGDLDRSRHAMQMALEKDPNYARNHWAAANLYVRLGDGKAADIELRRTAELDLGYLAQILDLVWRLYEDPKFILTTHVPATKEANLQALNYFMSRESPEGASLAWDRLKSFQTKPQERFDYVKFLLRFKKTRDASHVFAQGELPSEDNFYNASFETEPVNGGFDWQYSSSDEVGAYRDTSSVKDGLVSFVVSFSGKTDPDYSNLSHLLSVDKGKSYVLSFWMKTEAITSSEGPFVEVDDKRSEPQRGTNYWKEFFIPFTATADLVTVRLRRKPGDSPIKGKVWLDGFGLTERR